MNAEFSRDWKSAGRSDRRLKPVSPARAEARIAACVRRLPAERVALCEAPGRVLAQTVRADRPQPPFDRVMMDGFAIRFRAWAQGRRAFALRGIAAAGQPRLRLLDPAGCIEVMTGAVLPSGCDTVVPVEQAAEAEGLVRLRGREVRAGQFVHRRGSDCRRGATAIRPGGILRGPEIGVAASLGFTELHVACRPRVALVVTGDELVEPSRRPAPEQIRRSNDAALAACLSAAGLPPVRITHAPDDPRRLHAALHEALRAADVVLVTGGVSKGRHDHVPDALRRLRVAVRVHGVFQRPGGPMWFGARGGKLVFGLPGNPVSCLVCLHRYVLPALMRAQGAPVVAMRMSLAGAQPRAVRERTLFIPVRRDGHGLHRAPLLTSGSFPGLAGTSGFVEVAPGSRAGGRYPYWPWAGGWMP